MTKKRTREAKKRFVAAVAKDLREALPGKSLTGKRHKLQERFIIPTGHAGRKKGAAWEALEAARRVPGYLRNKRLQELRDLIGELDWQRFSKETGNFGYVRTRTIVGKHVSKAQWDLWDAVVADYINPLIAEGEKAIDRLERTAWKSEMPAATLRSLSALLHKRASALSKTAAAAPEFLKDNKDRSKSGPTRRKK